MYFKSPTQWVTMHTLPSFIEPHIRNMWVWHCPSIPLLFFISQSSSHFNCICLMCFWHSLFTFNVMSIDLFILSSFQSFVCCVSKASFYSIHPFLPLKQLPWGVLLIRIKWSFGKPCPLSYCCSWWQALASRWSPKCKCGIFSLYQMLIFHKELAQISVNFLK